MPITVTCVCGRSYPVKEECAGMRVRCQHCERILTVPGLARERPVRRDAGEVDGVPSGGGAALAIALACVLVLLLIGVGVTVLVLSGGDDKPAGPGETAAAPESPKPPDVPAEKPRPTPTPGGSDSPPPKPPDPAPKPPLDPTPAPPRELPPADARPWQGHRASVLAVSVTADGKHALSAAGGFEGDGRNLRLSADNSVRVWDLPGGREGRRVVGFPTGIAAAAFTRDGHFALVVGAGVQAGGAWARGADHNLHLWDLEAGKEVRAFKGHTRAVFAVAFSGDGRTALSGGPDRVARLWNVATGNLLHLLEGHGETITSVALSPDGRFALTGGMDKSVRLWDTATGRELKSFPGHQDIVWAVAFSPDGRQAVSGGGMQKDPAGSGYVSGAKDYDVRLWDVDSGRELKRFHGHQDAVGALAFSPDGQRVLTGSNDTTVRLWQVSTGRELRKFEGHSGLVRCVAFFPDGRRALSGSDDHTLRVWALPADLGMLVKRLKDADPTVRRDAARELGRYGESGRDAIPALLDALAGSDIVLRTEALNALGELGALGKEHVALVAPVLRVKDFPAGRLYALEALEAHPSSGVAAAPAVVDLLKDPDVVLRRRAAKLLALMGPPVRDRAFLPLIDALRDKDAELNRAAAVALVKTGPPRKAQVDDLARLLKDEHEAVRRYAVFALTELGADAGAAVSALLDTAGRDKVADMRRLALKALAKVRPKGADTLEACTKGLDDADVGVARQAVASLAAAGIDNGALPGLLRALEHADAMVVKVADDALQRARLGKGQVDELARALGSKKAATRLRILAVLGKLGPDAAKAVPTIITVLKEAKGAERARAVAILGQIGPGAKEAGPALAELLKVEDRSLRFAVCRALTQIKADEADKAVPYLVKVLRLTDADNEAQIAEKDKAKEMLINIGKPALPALAAALEGEFAGGNPRKLAGILNGAARGEILLILEKLGPEAKSPIILAALARMQSSDPFPKLRSSAKVLRGRIQSGAKPTAPADKPDDALKP